MNPIYIRHITIDMAIDKKILENKSVFARTEWGSLDVTKITKDFYDTQIYPFLSTWIQEYISHQSIMWECTLEFYAQMRTQYSYEEILQMKNRGKLSTEIWAMQKLLMYAIYERAHQLKDGRENNE